MNSHIDWLIVTVETNETGGVCRRETGSEGSGEIFECLHLEGPFGLQSTNASLSKTKPRSAEQVLATVTSNAAPVGGTDTAVVAHLWMMFASQCYWPTLKSDRIMPVYDWQASVEGRGKWRGVPAKWELLAGLGSLPLEVKYPGSWGETKAMYSISGVKSVVGTPIPTGFTFQEFRLGPLNEKVFAHEMVLRRRVDVMVTAARPGCSRTSLIPSPAGSAWIIDKRFDNGISNRPASYKNPVVGKWPAIEESKVLAKRQQASDLAILNRMKVVPEHQSKAGVMVVICSLLIAPLVVFGVLRVRKHASEEKLNGHG